MRGLRFSIAGLMAVVLAAAVGLAALRSPSPTWAGAIFLATAAVLGLGIVAAIYRKGTARAWWLGFCVFGWGYLAIVGFGRVGSPFPPLPTTQLLLALEPALGHPAATAATPRAPATAWVRRDYLRIGHALCSLLAALAGGGLARVVLRLPADRPDAPESATPAAISCPRPRWMRPALVAWAVLLLACALTAIRSGPHAGAWAGATFFLACGLLGLTALAAIFGSGRRRQAAVGAVLFGAGYLYLAFARAPYQLLPPGQVVSVYSIYQPLPTSELLSGLRRWTAAVAGGTVTANERILRALEQPLAMTFPDPTPLQDVLKYVNLATATPDHPGIPIYVDPIGLQAAERSLTSTMTIDLIGVPLKTSLRLGLEQLGLAYEVRGGCLRVTTVDDPGLDSPYMIAYHPRWNSPDSMDALTSDLDDPFLVAGHCLLAVLAAGFGAVMAPLVADACGRSSSPPERT